MTNKCLIILVVLFISNSLSSQKIDNLSSFRDVENDHYFRFNYDNDFFSSSDKNYTQGYSFELVLPVLEKNPINILFLKPKNYQSKFGLAIEHIGFTPDDYGSEEIQFGDRPFAAAIYLKGFVINTNTLSKRRLTSSFNVGIIGPGAFGKEMQVEIHKATGNEIPLGWKHQIKNDIVLNYEVGLEQQLYKYRQYFSIQAQSNAKLGTLFTNASLGFNGSLGIINSAFSSEAKKDKFQLYFYSQIFGSVVGYDATLQGGLITTDSPYTIATNDVKRFTGQYTYGFVLQTKGFYAEYTRTLITRKFSRGDSAKWGGFKLGFTF
ncbi:lipid A deacylase LpxR family protein [Croceibacter atlanticus]|jgi:hypothetical protein|uniref:lipid A deacylase LpxR family protein n=1 Tax=Croceibacter atlanticus TaxID=313588 RepID=UPI0024BB9CF4|nr:lipid A deacylase LpxR family protein [Croceibacter atlanticus]